VTVATDVEVLVHEDVFSGATGTDDYKAKGKFHCSLLGWLWVVVLRVDGISKQQNWPQWRGPNMNGATEGRGRADFMEHKLNVLWRWRCRKRAILRRLSGRIGCS
jgi:hypothetical protein